MSPTPPSINLYALFFFEVSSIHCILIIVFALPQLLPGPQKQSKTKNQKYKQTKPVRQTPPVPPPQKNTQCPFLLLLAHCSWSWPCSLHLVDITSNTPLKKDDFLFTEGINSIVNNFLVRNGTLCPFRQCWNSVWFEPVLSCACRHSLCECMCVSALLYLDDAISLESFMISGCYNFF